MATFFFIIVHFTHISVIVTTDFAGSVCFQLISVAWELPI